ncbi:phage regulator Rha-like protein [Rhodoferax ferrireducens]|uniref:Phage regulator Rha-like protein n=1 Tax=Rhodoferax ferrireducens TaxID=192843 RepID=A0ABU2C264_9BURK|nr:Rha family transcriptional regulator [Rhodoferax ferrireducens]MDR7375414.1 phage regulator Rha-like protein [Rhodoferax ferrireducens]
MNAITIQPLPLVIKDMPRVDSRLLAANMHNQHRTTVALIDKYQPNLAAFGKVLFQIAPSADGKTGQKERVALLNEDQAFFLVALSRNTPRVVELKGKLVKAFAEARRAAQVHTTEYLPGYHELHDQFHALAVGSPNERFVHMNLNKLVNRVVGIGSGQRGDLTAPKQSLMVVAQDLATRAMHGAANHHEAYAFVKAVLINLGRVLEVSNEPSRSQPRK